MAAIGLLVAAGVIALLVALLSSGGGGPAGHPAAGRKARSTTTAAGPVRVAVAQQGELPSALQDAASAPDARGGILVIGGLDSAEQSLAGVLRLSGAGVGRAGALPAPLHDACAAETGGEVYLFGGGVVESFSGIMRVVPGGTAEQVGSLPSRSSDVACASLDGTVYVIGGYNGSEPLRTIVAWRPGGAPRVAGTLPKPLRYTAAGAVGGRILIAGGTSGIEASSDIFSFEPATGRVRRIGRLPSGRTHAPGLATAGALLVIGGRGAETGSQRSSILAVSPSGAVAVAGKLPRKISDLSAAPLGTGALLAGGVDAAGNLRREVLRLTVTR